MSGAEGRATEPSPRRRVPPFVGLLAVYALVFAALAWPWLSVAGTSTPAGTPTDPRDEQIVLFVLTWIARMLGGEPGRILDLPIHFPAPGQLTGSEHFATYQLVFAPLYHWTGNALLAANLTVFATYPLAAAAMHTLLRRMGASCGAAVVGALIFSLGPLRLPANLHMLHFGEPEVSDWGGFGLPLAAGLGIVIAAKAVPYVGGAIGFVTLLTGLGMLVGQIRLRFWV